VGETYQWNVGWSGQGLGASRDQLAIEASYSSSLLTSNDHLWLIDTSISGFWNADQDTSTNIDTDTEEFENLWWTAATRYHYRQSDQWALFARLRLDYTDGLTDDRQLTLGGSNGLRGYEQNYQTGDRSFVVNLEQRYYSDWHPFRLIRVGAAAFLDVGRAWFNDTDNGSNGDVLANVGVGLRINSSRSQRGNVLHIDLAFPLSKDDDVDSVQILVTVKETF
jgi:hemolysin activation/secretion protein